MGIDVGLALVLALPLAEQRGCVALNSIATTVGNDDVHLSEPPLSVRLAALPPGGPIESRCAPRNATGCEMAIEIETGMWTADGQHHLSGIGNIGTEYVTESSTGVVPVTGMQEASAGGFPPSRATVLEAAADSAACRTVAAWLEAVCQKFVLCAEGLAIAGEIAPAIRTMCPSYGGREAELEGRLEWWGWMTPICRNASSAEREVMWPRR